MKIIFDAACKKCYGSGRDNDSICNYCDGIGRVLNEDGKELMNFLEKWYGLKPLEEVNGVPNPYRPYR